MESSEIGGAKPHKLDLSSLKPLPEKKEVGSGVKKPESQNLLGTKTPGKGAPDAREPKPSQPNPAEQQASERLGKPPPQEAANVGENSVQGQGEQQAGDQEEAWDADIPVKVYPSAAYPNPLKLNEPKDDKSTDKS